MSRSCQSSECEGSPTEVPLYPGAVQILLPGFLADYFVPGSLVLRVDIVSLQRLHLPLKLSFDAITRLIAADYMVQVEVAEEVFRYFDGLHMAPFRVARDARVAISDIGPIWKIASRASHSVTQSDL